MNTKFITYCQKGNLEEAKKLYSLGGVDIHADNEEAFRWSCWKGHLNIAQWLYSLGDINIHAEDDSVFRGSCASGHMNIVIWLYSLGGVNIHADNDYAFRFSCYHHTLNIVLWLLSVGKFSNNLVDKHLPNELHEHAFQLGYLPIDEMKPAYDKYKAKIKDQVKEKNIDGPISLFEIDGLVSLIVCYV